MLEYEEIFSFCLIRNLLFVDWEELIIGNIKFTVFDLNRVHALGNIAIDYFNLSIFF